MTMNLFSQFDSPKILGIPLMLIAMLMPLLLLSPTDRPIANRTATLQAWITLKFTKQLLTPLNKPGHHWALPLTMVMYYLVTTNLLGLLPYTFTPTTQLSLNMGLAIPLWLSTVLLGLRTQPTTALAHLLPPGTPVMLIPALIIIETISTLIRPVALGVRLTANLTAGHLLITLISATTLELTTMTPLIPITTTALLLLLTGLEIAVAVIQAYVFTLLLSLYLQENT
uniref:ATP synthase subunit a n=1 Tax=Tarentola mauritanica TaxID=8569 RepID=H9CXM0_TARMA|nr:ATP synthase F0 subunit 6 [Tarentola mauritanica]AFC39654.1 ATP synthase F0 subunit 6 [Tarentola mauritanica]AFC39667.1 ATP synthase F0 subunit 6 [Tarentola mauritanica]AFC39693.1 ATP synthase F0 subunit 6 [Tarentola mauritanica]AFC39706.1 ATP synthase F0 subunit 6 [Tarentola mauritanica]